MKRGRHKGIHICGKSLQDYRISKGLTQTEFGGKINMNYRSIQRIENEPDYRVSRITAYKIAYQMIHSPVSEEEKPVWELVHKWNKEEV